MADSKNGKVGSVLVVGGGIAGMEAALQLADSGYLTTIVTKDASLGGRMAQLDKTFPTNDCSTCMLSPRMVVVGRHPNIDIMILSSLEKLDGEPGNFKATIHKKATYVDFDKCTGCEECTKKCPTKKAKIPNEFNEGIDDRRAISLMFPQAVPRKCVIDPEYCIKLNTGKCGVCEKVCKAGAINYEDKDQDIVLDVGAVILAPGYKLTDPKLLGEYGYGRIPNVVTSLEFERLLSASGPYAGHVQRPSDNAEPKKIAFIQCVGSRNERIGRGYCSSVCCMYATKQAIVGKEHVPGMDVTIFYKDMRAFGKGFDRYWENARDSYGVKYKRSMVSTIKENPANNNTIIKYLQEGGGFEQEEFDLVVLSCGLEPSPAAVELCGKLDIELDKYNFCKTSEYLPIETSREGVYVCGAFESPKDIPESVVQSTGAAGRAMALLGDSRWSLTRTKEYPEEKQTAEEEPRVGVFVCHCGLNIASVIDVEKVVEEAKKIPGVVYCENLLFTCSQDAQEHMKDLIVEHKLNRVVISACSPRTHEPLFREMLRDTGLNPYLFEMANIRDQGSWVHASKPKEATTKAIALTRMAVNKSKQLEMLQTATLKVVKEALVLGGGVSGMTTAASLAEQGYQVHLVEQTTELGGEAMNLRTTMDGKDIRPFVTGLIEKTKSNDKIKIYFETTVTDINGGVGNFRSVLTDKDGNNTEIEHATLTIATGGVEYKPTEYMYGEDDNVLTVRELEQQVADGGLDPAGVKDVVFIQCVGSRCEERNYCSRVCCSASIKNAITLKEKNPGMNVYVMYRDIRTYGMREDYYRKAREMGVIFVRFDKDEPPVVAKNGGGLSVTVKDQTMGRELQFPADRVALAAAVVAREDAINVSRRFKITLSTDGFFQEAHVKLRPIDFASDGEFMCGLAHSPMSVDEAVSQAMAASARAGSVLSKDELESEAHVAVVNEELCAGCVTCVRVCPYGIPKMNDKGIAEISPVECHGCGTCVGQCPAKAIELPGFKDVQLGALIEELFTYEPVEG